MAKRVRQPKYVAPTTYEGWLAEAHLSWNTHQSDRPVPTDPTYFYTVGENVNMGNLNDCRIEEVLDGGVRYHISYHDKGETYGTPYDAGRKPRIVWWIDISPVSTMENTSFFRERTRAQYISTGLDCLIGTSYYRGLMENPEYQRDYVWTLEDKQRLVRSIFNRCDIGKFVLVEHPYPEHRLEIVDGKQRLRAIMDFMEGRFAYEGKTWYQLSRKDKHAFTDIMVQYCQLDAERVKKSDILWLFLSINEGGVPQAEEHVAKARKLYQEALEKESHGQGQ